MVNCYKDLKIWQVAMDLCANVYSNTEDFPKNEMFGLTSQMRRAAISIASNIAEGFARKYPKDFKRFLLFSRGSLAELETQLGLSERLNYISKGDLEKLYDTTDHLGKMITKFSATLK